MMAQKQSSNKKSNSKSRAAPTSALVLQDKVEVDDEVSEVGAHYSSIGGFVHQSGQLRQNFHSGVVKNDTPYISSSKLVANELSSPWRLEAPRRPSCSTTIEGADMHMILAYDLAAWSYRMHIAIYQDTPLNAPPANAPWTSPSQGDSQERTQAQGYGLQQISESLTNQLPKRTSIAHDSRISPETTDLFPLPQLPSPQLTLPQLHSSEGLPESESGSQLSSLDQVPEARSEKFPLRLHKILEDLAARKGGKEIASFLPHGRAFRVYKIKEFAAIMKDYFHMTLYSSFQRQLLLYKFERIKRGKEKGAYFHELFQRDRPIMSTYMRPMKTLRRSQPKEKSNSPCKQGDRDNLIALLQDQHQALTLARRLEE